MLTNEIVGLPIVNDIELPNTLDRLTEKVKVEKNSLRKSSKKGKFNKINEGSAGDDRNFQDGPKNRKRKAPVDNEDLPKRTRTEGSYNTPTEKTDWKLMKKERKELKEARKRKEEPVLYVLSKEAKCIWEDLRQDTCPKDKRAELSKKLYSLISPHIKRFVFSHDIVRVIECLLAVGSPKIRTDIFENLKENMVALMKNKYSHFFVVKMLKYGDKTQRSFIIKSLEGQIVSLLRHQYAAPIVEQAYNEHAMVKERRSIIQEFFGPEFRFFKDENASGLDVILLNHPEKKEVILRNFKQNLLNVISKSPWKLTIVHTLLIEFLNHCDAESRADFIDSLKDVLIHILHTRDGAKVAMMCLWHGTPKDRKTIVKSFKTHVEKICTDVNGYTVMLSLFDSVDDTVLVSKALLQEMMENIDKVLLTESGRKVVLYLIQPRNKTYFHPNFVKDLAKGDNNQYSKKERNIRSKELFDSILDDLLGCFERNLVDWINNNNITLVLKALFESSMGSQVPKLKALFHKFVNLTTGDNYIDKVTIFKIYKALILNEKEDTTGTFNFTDIFLSKLEESQSLLKSFISINRGCLTLIVILEKKLDHLVQRVLNLMNSHKKFILELGKTNPQVASSILLLKNHGW